jgi:hypothetical protein
MDYFNLQEFGAPDIKIAKFTFETALINDCSNP